MAHVVFPLWFLSFFLSFAAFRGSHAVDYEVINKATGTPTGTRFNTEIGVEYTKQAMKSASEFAWQIFEQPTEEDRKNVTLVTLIFEYMPGVVTLRINDEISVFDHDIANYSGDVKKKFTEDLYLVIAVLWGWDGQRQAPITLTYGIAEYVTLKAGYIYSDFARPGEGDHWDERWDVTARFLEYCNSLRNGFVADLNRKMKTGYSPHFFVELLGKNIDQLWSDYKAAYKCGAAGEEHRSTLE